MEVRPTQTTVGIEGDRTRYLVEKRTIPGANEQIKIKRQQRRGGNASVSGSWSVSDRLTRYLNEEDARAVRDLLDEWLDDQGDRDAS